MRQVSPRHVVRVPIHIDDRSVRVAERFAAREVLDRGQPGVLDELVRATIERTSMSQCE